MEYGNKKTITSCARPLCSCPFLEMDDDKKEVVVKDDFGGSAKMSYTEFYTLAKKFMEYV